MVVSILAIADTVSPFLYDHFRADQWQSIDMVLAAGDLPPEYLDFLCSNLNVPVLYVRGNHDGGFGDDRYDGSRNVHGRIVEVKGLRIAGFEGCQRYNNGAIQYSEAEMNRVARKLRLLAHRTGPADIILAHAPPAGVNDGPDPCHRGFACFVDLIQQWAPAYFVHGHMHVYPGQPRVTTVGATTVLNAYGYQKLEVVRPVPVAAVPPARAARLQPAGAGPLPGFGTQSKGADSR
ncbi:MAG: metallophosphoesterase family protein [Chloroflexota bacterium]